MIVYSSSGPATEPVTLAEAKLWIRAATGTVEDSLVSSLITAARVYIERVTGQLLVSQTVTATLDDLPALLTLKGPVTAVTSITVDGVELDPSEYVAHAASGRVVLTATEPKVETLIAGVVITYTAGFTTVPAPLKQAIQHIVSHLYEHRETNEPLPQVVDLLLSSYKQVAL